MNDIEHNFVDTISTIDAIDTWIEILKKEVADFKGHRERLFSSISGPSRFGDQTLISRLR